MLAVYDDLVDKWMTNLPQRVPVQARVLKHRTIRQVSIELCLSSVAISLRPKVADDKDGEDTDYMIRDNSPALYSPEMTPASSYLEPSVTLPSPARTPSVFSHVTNTTSSETGQDSAITRLRQYAELRLLF